MTKTVGQVAEFMVDCNHCMQPRLHQDGGHTSLQSYQLPRERLFPRHFVTTNLYDKDKFFAPYATVPNYHASGSKLRRNNSLSTLKEMLLHSSHQTILLPPGSVIESSVNEMTTMLSTISEAQWEQLLPAFSEMCKVLQGLSYSAEMSTSEILCQWGSTGSAEGRHVASIDAWQSYEQYFKSHFIEELRATYGSSSLGRIF